MPGHLYTFSQISISMLDSMFQNIQPRLARKRPHRSRRKTTLSPIRTLAGNLACLSPTNVCPVPSAMARNRAPSCVFFPLSGFGQVSQVAECRNALAMMDQIAGQIVTINLGCVVLRLPVRISWLSWMHRVQLHVAAVVGRPECVGLVIKYRLVRSIGLHPEHSSGTCRKVLRDLTLGFRRLSIRAFRFSEKVWERGMT